MLFIAPQLLEGLRLDFFFLNKHCHREIENTRTNNFFEIEVNVREQSSAFKGFFGKKITSKLLYFLL